MVERRKKDAEAEAERQPPAYWGWFHVLPEKDQEALVELARLTVKEMRDLDRADHAELDQYHKARRKTNEANELDALFTQYALALSFFERWQKRGVASIAQVIRIYNVLTRIPGTILILLYLYQTYTRLILILLRILMSSL